MTKEVVMAILILVAGACTALPLKAQPVVFEKSTADKELLAKLLSAQHDSVSGRIKWKPATGEVVEFNAESGDGFLYSDADTVFVVNDSVKIIIFHTAGLKMIGDIIIPTNSCQHCGVNVGYAMLTKNKKGWTLTRFKKNMGLHGSFGENNYRLSLLAGKYGNIIIKLDEFEFDNEKERVVTTLYKNATRLAQNISEENNQPSVAKDKRGYYQYACNYFPDRKEQIRIVKRGYRIDRKTGKRIIFYINQQIQINPD